MFRVVELFHSRRVPHVAVLALMSIGFAGCSADMSTRLSENPFSNPFASQPEATASVPPAAVERRKLPQYARPQSQGQSSAPAIAAPQSYPAASAGGSGGGRVGVTSYAPPGQPIEITGSAAPRSVAANRGSGHNGTTIIVGTSDTLDTLSRRYNVSPAAILQANGYRGPRTLSPGQQLIIPRQIATAAAPAPAAAAAPSPAAPASRAVAAAPTVHVVNRGDTLLSISRRNHVPVAELARANGLASTSKLKLGMKLTVPGARTAAVAPAAQPAAIQPAAAQPVAALAPPATKLAAAGGPPQSARLAQATTAVANNPPPPPGKATEATRPPPPFPQPGRREGVTSHRPQSKCNADRGPNTAG